MTDTLERVWAKKVAHDDGYRLVVTDVPNEILQEYVRADLKPKVKQLEWSLDRFGTLEADFYWIAQDDWDLGSYWSWGYNVDVLGKCAERSDCIAAAQADYERRILEALE
jgi:hypothetical protein